MHDLFNPGVLRMMALKQCEAIYDFWNPNGKFARNKSLNKSFAFHHFHQYPLPMSLSLYHLPKTTRDSEGQAVIGWLLFGVLWDQLEDETIQIISFGRSKMRSSSENILRNDRIIAVNLHKFIHQWRVRLSLGLWLYQRASNRTECDTLFSL